MVIKIFLLVLIQSLLALAHPLESRNDPKSQYLVTNLPGLYLNIAKDDRPLMFSGQLELYPENSTHYYFWKYSDPKKLPEAEKKTIFWLNGGPGCSSMDGALMEAGPFRVNKDGEITYNNGSWHKSGDIVFVDQPAGTGFSYSDEYDHDLDQIVIEFLKFMEKFFELFPEDASNEIYFAGESYAGQYIPYIAEGILRRNKKLGKNDKSYNLKGLLIGNGWISPNEQSLSYLPYSVQAGIIDSNNLRWKEILRQHEECQRVVDDIEGSNGDTIKEFEVASTTCEKVLNKILGATHDELAPKDQQCYNVYDYTLMDTYPSCGMNWPPDLAYITPFLRDQNVMNDLNLINHKKWKECSGKVGRYFTARNSKPSVYLIPSLLEEIEIVLFNGNRDIICNYLGTESFIKKMTWNGKQGFSEENEAIDWIYDGNTAGYIKSERNLTFVNVFDASHMVPFDKPEISRSLMDLITGNYDEKEIENKSDKKKMAYVTYPLGVRQSKQQEAGDKQPESPTEEEHKTVPSQTSNSIASSLVPSSSATAAAEDKTQRTTSRITRLIQLLVIIVLIWGVYVLYSSYRSRPSSIIKTGPSGKKKNVQWADQLRQFQEEEFELNEQGILSRAINKLKTGDSRGAYAPASEDIEMNAQNENNGHENFVIETDDEDETSETDETQQPK